MPSIETLLLVAAVLLALSVLASKASGRLGVPALVLFLVIGMLAGSDGPGGIEFDNPWVAQLLGVVALAYILFAGGLDTEWSAVRPVLAPGVALATLAVLLSALLMGGFAVLALGFRPLEGMLLGGIVASTDAAAVFAVLRSRGASLKGKLKPLIELESGSNDPMAVFLTLGLIRLLTVPGATPADLIPVFVIQMAVGGGVGLLAGRALQALVNWARLEYEGLYPVLTLAWVLLVYGATAQLGGNGFLACYVAGLVVGNRDFVHKKSLLRFHDGLAWLMQIAMFLTLGLLVFPSRLVGVAGTGLATAAFLMLCARPASVFLTLLPFRISLRETSLVAWVGLRGAVPIILATFPLLARLPGAETIFNLVFFVVLTSILVQGTSVPFVARLLGCSAPAPVRHVYPLEFIPAVDASSRLEEIVVEARSPAGGRSIVELNLPRGALVVLIGRGGQNLVPSGALVIEKGDRLLVLGDPESLEITRRILHQGPAAGRPAPRKPGQAAAGGS